MQQYHITQDGVQLGPFVESEVFSMITSGKLRPDDLCWTEGMEKWRPVSEQFQRASNVPPPLYRGPAPARMEDSVGMRMLMPVGRSFWAILAGYLGLLSLVIVPAPLALIVSIVAILDLRKSKATDKPKYGMGRAIFGLIMGILGTVALLYFVLKSS